MTGDKDWKAVAYGSWQQPEDHHQRGVYRSPHGFVLMNRSWYPSGNHAYVEMIYEGRHRIRFFDRAYSERYMVTLARRFAEEAAHDR